jgi:hypothetical protein
MSIKSIKTYVGEYGSSSVLPINVLISDEISYTKKDKYSEFVASNPWFDTALTICIPQRWATESPWRIENLEVWGLTDIRYFDSTTVTKLYITKEKYIAIGTDSSIGLYNFGVAYVKNDNVVFNFSNFPGLLFYNITSNQSSPSGQFNMYPASTSDSDIVYTSFSTSATIRNAMFGFWDDSEPYEEDDDPYSQGGNSGEGGGTGTFSGTGDSIDFPSLPTLSAVSTGFITLFNPSIAEMQNLATYMWSDVFDIGLYKTLFADPMDCILGCSIVPVAVPNGGTKTVNVGNVSTGISMTVAASQYVEVDCGTLNVEEYWGSYLDYDPYTKAEIYLPYCGTHALQVDDIMGKAVHVKYHVDILSGACCAYVKCGSSVMYSFVGQCSSSIPISANDWTNVVNGALTIAASVGSLIATGGASAPMAVGTAAAVTGTIYGGGIKQNVEKSGSMGGTGGMLAIQTPYLILTRPRQALPKKQNTYTGYPSFITTKLEDLKGYTEIDSIRITGVPATDAELNELESILKSGVIF